MSMDCGSPGRGPQGDAAAVVVPGRLVPGHRERLGLQVHHVDRAGVQRPLHGPLERPRGPGHVPGGGDGGALAQHGGVGAGQAHRQLGGDLHVDQAGHAARAEQGPLAPGLPDHAGVHYGAGLDGLERVDLHRGGQVGLGLDHALVPDDRALLDPGEPHDVGVLADHAAPQGDALADVDVVVHHGAVQEGALLDHDVAADHGVLAQVRAGLDLGVVADAQRAGEHRLRVDLGALADPDARRDLEAGDVGLHPAAQHIGLRLHVALEGADVLPVVLGDVAVQRGTAFEQLRENVTRPVDRLARRDFLEHLGFHDVQPGVDRVGKHLAPCRLLQEPLDPAIIVSNHDAELKRVRDPGQGHRDQRALFLVEPHEPGQVHVGERIARDDQEGLVTQRVLGVPHAARGAERHLLGGVLQAHPELLAVAEVVADERGEELDGHDGLIEAVPLEQPEHVLHDRPVSHREQRLGLVRGHRPQPCSFAPCHDDRFHRICSSFPGFRLRCTPRQATSRVPSPMHGPARRLAGAPPSHGAALPTSARAPRLTRILTWARYNIAAHQYRTVPQVAKAQPITRASVPPQPG